MKRPKEKIREYVHYGNKEADWNASETEHYLLGCYQNAAYNFYYEKERITTLNYEFLTTVKTEAEAYVI
jgi:adenine-specific DNA-methyltransferase